MKKYSFFAAALLFGFSLAAQTAHHDKSTLTDPKPGFFDNVIVKKLDSANTAENPAPEKARKFKVDLSGMDLPTEPAVYTQVWHNTPVSQGNTGTCWCFSTTSFYESEAYRVTGQKIKLSEMFPVYWEYVERAIYFVKNRGKMNVGEGSETNAVAEVYKKYGTVPETDYTGLLPGQPYHNHTLMFTELDNYLKGVKDRGEWNEEQVVSTVKSIMNHYMGEPPVKIKAGSREVTPVEYLTKILKLQMDDYVNFMSLSNADYYNMQEYKVGDNWWHAKNYNNIPLDEFVDAVKTAIKNGYSISIGGDVSEPGFNVNNVAMIPTFDIPSEYIDDNARLMRFLNGATTDDHAMHLVGYQIKDGKTWFLIKDSGSGSRNCGESCKGFGYYFMSEDYVKLKMMTITVNKNAVKDVLKKMKS